MCTNCIQQPKKLNFILFLSLPTGILPQRRGRFSRKGLPTLINFPLCISTPDIILVKAAFSEQTRGKTTDSQVRQTWLGSNSGRLLSKCASLEANEQLICIKSSDMLGPGSQQQNHISFLKVFQQRCKELSFQSLRPRKPEKCLPPAPHVPLWH